MDDWNQLTKQQIGQGKEPTRLHNVYKLAIGRGDTEFVEGYLEQYKQLIDQRNKQTKLQEEHKLALSVEDTQGVEEAREQYKQFLHEVLDEEALLPAYTGLLYHDLIDNTIKQDMTDIASECMEERHRSQKPAHSKEYSESYMCDARELAEKAGLYQRAIDLAMENGSFYHAERIAKENELFTSTLEQKIAKGRLERKIEEGKKYLQKYGLPRGPRGVLATFNHLMGVVNAKRLAKAMKGITE